jgi:hypothetical protein
MVAGDWQPIESAPRDRPVLVSDGVTVNVARWELASWVCVINGGIFLEGYGEEYVNPEPTYWMPLPDTATERAR